ncbi:MAG: hypothetical protein ACFFED_08335 [Candidatus Thorarchaeota archaeon]
MTEDRPQIGPDAPFNLQENARRYFKNAESFREQGQHRSMAECYEKALELGKASDTPDGLAIAAEACLYLGHRAKTHAAWGLALKHYEESISLGRRSGTPEGLYAATRAAWNLGNTLEEAGMEGLEDAFRDAIQLGRASQLQAALEVAAKAAFNLASNLYPDEGSVPSEQVETIAEVWREAIELGNECGTRDGKEVASKATRYLSELTQNED